MAALCPVNAPATAQGIWESQALTVAVLVGDSRASRLLERG